MFHASVANACSAEVIAASPRLRAVHHKLSQALQPVHMALVDNSAAHAGHGAHVGEATHLGLLMVSPQFEGQTLMQRHRAVHAALKEELATFLHALELRLYTPAEAEAL